MTGFITDGYSYGLNTDHIRKIDIRRTAALVFFTERRAGNRSAQARQSTKRCGRSWITRTAPAITSFRLHRAMRC